jgi:hypothetical protein
MRDDSAMQTVKTSSIVNIRVKEHPLLLELVVLAQELFQSVLIIW